MRLRIGTAGWSIPKPSAASFPAEGSHLERYARVCSAVEINSSFYRPHQPATYARWAASVPADFRFAVKMPREITHSRRLRNIDAPLEVFLSQIQALESKLGPILLQLPPSFGFDTALIEGFCKTLRRLYAGEVICEPRHASWFTETGEAMLAAYRIARVAADPAPVPAAARPGGWNGLVYRRLHGAPKIYYSAYSDDDLDATARLMRADTQPSWCIFDNTAFGEATANALQLMAATTPRQT